MSIYSNICKFISEHSDDWRTLLQNEYKIKIKEDGAYAIFNYNYECDFHNPIVQEARGIIIDTERLEVVCWPFRKFGNHTESYADEIDWDSARVLEKVDGSIIKLWYDARAEKWQFSTNGIIRAENAPIESLGALSYMSVIRTADNFDDIDFDALDKDTTYIFELVSPQTQVVIKYDTASLYHIGTRNNKTGIESDDDIGIKKPMQYPLTSLEGAINAAIALNGGEDEVEKEGFVVVDKNWHRVKVKSPDYVLTHRITSVKVISKRDAVYLLLHDKEGAQRLCEKSPDVAPAIKFYEYKLTELYYQADQMGKLATCYYNEFSHDRAAVAKIIAGHPLGTIGFRCIDTGARASEILNDTPIEKICKFIPDYEAPSLAELFKAKSDK